MFKADMKGTIRLVGVCEGRHPLCRPGDRCYNSFGNHVIKGALNLIPGTLWVPSSLAC